MEPQWPEGYESYGAFMWKENIYFREELLPVKPRYDITPESSPKGYLCIGFITSDYNEAILAQFPSYIKTKNFNL